MKKFSLLLAILTSMYVTPLLGMSIGREGTPYVKNGIEWQKVSYKNDDTGFTAAMPGTLGSGISNGDVFSYSHYQDVDYEINCSLNERYVLPKKEAQFMEQVSDVFESRALIIPIHSNQKKVKYIAELHFNEESRVIRIYCSKNCLYWAHVEGEDLSLAPLFFDSIEITQ
jgi:hypothetical protein